MLYKIFIEIGTYFLNLGSQHRLQLSSSFAKQFTSIHEDSFFFQRTGTTFCKRSVRTYTVVVFRRNISMLYHDLFWRTVNWQIMCFFVTKLWTSSKKLPVAAEDSISFRCSTSTCVNESLIPTKICSRGRWKHWYERLIFYKIIVRKWNCIVI